MLAVSNVHQHSVINCVFVCVCLCVHALKGEWLKLSSPNLIDLHTVNGRTLACTDPEVKKVKGQGHMYGMDL